MAQTSKSGGKKKQQTVRERTQASGESRSTRVRGTAGKVTGPLKKARQLGKREYHPVRLPQNRWGKILNKRGRIFPKFLRNAWVEILQVTWPNARDTVRLTIAVFIFAVVFAVIVGIIDYGLDKLFKEVIIGK